MVEPLNYIEKCNKISQFINKHIKNGSKGLICIPYDDKPVVENDLNYIKDNIYQEIAEYFDATIISIMDNSNENEILIDYKMEFIGIALYISIYNKRETNELLWIDIIAERK